MYSKREDCFNVKTIRYSLALYESIEVIPQGSTVENIFINLRDICYYKGNIRHARVNTVNNPNAIDTRNRLMYTAISRASKKAIILY